MKFIFYMLSWSASRKTYRFVLLNFDLCLQNHKFWNSTGEYYQNQYSNHFENNEISFYKLNAVQFTLSGIQSTGETITFSSIFRFFLSWRLENWREQTNNASDQQIYFCGNLPHSDLLPKVYRRPTEAFSGKTGKPQQTK
jgi:hypothetical protein